MTDKKGWEIEKQTTRNRLIAFASFALLILLIISWLMYPSEIWAVSLLSLLLIALAIQVRPTYVVIASIAFLLISMGQLLYANANPICKDPSILTEIDIVHIERLYEINKIINESCDKKGIYPPTLRREGNYWGYPIFNFPYNEYEVAEYLEIEPEINPLPSIQIPQGEKHRTGDLVMKSISVSDPDYAGNFSYIPALDENGEDGLHANGYILVLYGSFVSDEQRERYKENPLDRIILIINQDGTVKYEVGLDDNEQ